MKKVSIKIGSILAFVLFFANGCTTNEGSDFSTKSQKVFSENTANREKSDGPENPANPQDVVGQQHNTVVSSVMINANNLETIDDYINFSRQEALRQYNYSSNSPTNEQIKTVIYDVRNNFKNVISNSNFSEESKFQLERFVAIMTDSKFDNDYNALKSEIVNFENDLLRNVLIPSVEKDKLLQVTSIGRYSSFYWFNLMLEIKNENSAESNVLARRRWWKWALIGVCDALGAIGGAIAGTPTGIAAVGMAVVGGAGASGGAATVLDYLTSDNP
ncbi:hypothetical protein [Flavobacterium aurantiibacter]|uniref:Glycine zipper family protein n=1 Tax=Flavobacterium aurantiibacter TaxID=2023067 RepID=A0A255ZXA0_9FLAO|nr:hypothetical protein [Flavobacterium aurantiibacter]OYQ46113.1 hypothetical protein CHX27_04990 [Flavobacterium aurantiibacter]